MNIIAQTFCIQLRGAVKGGLERAGRIDPRNLELFRRLAPYLCLIQIDPAGFGDLKFVRTEPLPFLAIDHAFQPHLLLIKFVDCRFN